MHGSLLSILILAGAAIALALLVRWHAATTVYCCPHCAHEFRISAWRDFFSPNAITTKYARCPQCGQREWMRAKTRF